MKYHRTNYENSNEVSSGGPYATRSEALAGGIAAMLGKKAVTSERRNITQPADWWAAFEEQAKAEGVNLSEWVGACCVANLLVSRALSDRPTVGAPKRAKDEGR